MAKLTTKQIISLAREIVAQNAGGIHYSDLVNQIKNSNPDTPTNTIHGSVWDLHREFPQEIGKPSRGLFVPVTTNKDDIGESKEEVVQKDNRVFKESEFYEPFGKATFFL